MSDQVGNHELDELDLKIIELLRVNGRASNRKMAEALGIAPSTVGARVRRMERTGALRIVALADFAVQEFDSMFIVGVDVEGRDPEDVAQELAVLDEVFSVHLMSGAHDIEMTLVLHSNPQLQSFLRDRISTIRGIHRLHAAVTVDVLHYHFDTLLSS